MYISRDTCIYTERYMCICRYLCTWMSRFLYIYYLYRDISPSRYHIDTYFSVYLIYVYLWRSICVYMYLCVYIYRDLSTSIYISIYTEREREKCRERNVERERYIVYACQVACRALPSPVTCAAGSHTHHTHTNTHTHTH